MPQVNTDNVSTWQALLWKPLPSLVFGAFAAVSGLLYLCLPETLGHLLPDTIDEAELFGRRRRPPPSQ